MRERYDKVFSWFEANYGDITTELLYRSPFELLVAVMLSAQCTDERINKVTPVLFRRYASVEDLAGASEGEIYALIQSVSYPHAKSRHLLQTAQLIVERYGGEVPKEMEDLLSLPGVGRKTANVVSSILWGRPTIGVDTHVFRVANRIGLCRGARTPLAVEQQLLKNISKKYITKAHHWLIHHGRYTCLARKPRCEKCGFVFFCEWHKKIRTVVG